MTATEVLKIVQEMPETERNQFDALYRACNQSQVRAEISHEKKIPMPDFMKRLREDFPDGIPPGKPCSELIDEGRGDY